MTSPFVATVCDYSIQELIRVFNKKFPHKMDDLNRFLSKMILSVQIIQTPPEDEKLEIETSMRDFTDRPILRAAIKNDIDIILTGDKDFFALEITRLKILASADFLDFKE